MARSERPEATVSENRITLAETLGPGSDVPRHPNYPCFIPGKHVTKDRVFAVAHKRFHFMPLSIGDLLVKTSGCGGVTVAVADVTGVGYVAGVAVCRRNETFIPSLWENIARGRLRKALRPNYPGSGGFVDVEGVGYVLVVGMKAALSGWRLRAIKVAIRRAVVGV